jgi:Tricorn protease C1 domain
MIFRYRLSLSLVLCTSVLICLALTPRFLEAQNVQRGEMEDILKIVSSDVQKNFYDPNLKGLDWPALTEETRQRIEGSNNTGQMILASLLCSQSLTIPTLTLFLLD